MDEWEVHNSYYRKEVHTEDDDFVFEEALNSLIRSGDSIAMFNLAAHYFDDERYDLALKYFEAAEECGERYASEYLGDIWYYGYTGEKDYEKAFRYFSKTAPHHTHSTIMLADMYRYGHYVEQDYDRYCSMIEELYEWMVRYPRSVVETDAYYRMGELEESRGEISGALRLYLIARGKLEERMSGAPKKKDLDLMSDIISAIYRLSEFDDSRLGLFDLYHVLKKPTKVGFEYEGSEYLIESVDDEGGISISFDGRWFRSPGDLFRKAKIGDMLLTQLRDDIRLSGC